MTSRSVCVVSGNRADYGLLYWPMRAIAEEPELDLQIIATGAHLAPEFGLSVDEFAKDGFIVNERVESLLSGDTPTSITKSTAVGVMGFADALERLRPDFLLVLGDRYEVFAAAVAALFAKIPVAHLYGGDTTEGAFDEALRHSITKMAHVHFVTNEVSARRVRQLGEDPDHVHNTGAPSIDYLMRGEKMDRDAFFGALEFLPRKTNLLVTFHPVTLGRTDSAQQLEELLAALHDLGPDYGVIMTMPNVDPGGRALARMVEEFSDTHENVTLRTTLGMRLYPNALRHADAVVGNSSSGLYEAPAFGTPTVDVGDRQKGRLSGESVFHCEAERGAIREAVARALATDCSDVENPYGDGNSSARIVAVLKAIPDPPALLRKRFFDLEDS